MAETKGFKQDMVVSIRYRNDLPPPPMPPKFLDIDTGGLAQYLTTSYASGLAKREEPNIEVDAEGGMPIDMIGVPGYFLGDESAIMAPEVQPVLDPADQALLMSLDQLKSQGAKNNVSFLRKTQYMTSSQMARANDAFMRPSLRTTQKPQAPKAPPVPVTRDDPENIKRQIQKGFDLAYPDSIPFNPPEAKANPITTQEREAWRNPVHPDNPRLKPVEFYPIIPDLETGTDMASNWQALKFDKPPLPPHKGRRDDRIDVGLLMAAENAALMPAWRAAKEAFERDPEKFADPGPEPYTWSLSVPKHPDSTSRIRQLFDDSNPRKDDPGLMEPLLEESADGSLRLPFERVRVYPRATQDTVDPHRVMALSLVESQNLSRHSRFRKQGNAAYYYPILERVKMRADRGNLSKSTRNNNNAAGDDDDIPDQVMVLFKEPNAKEKRSRAEFRGEYDALFKDEFEELTREAQAEEEAEHADMILQEQGELHEGAQDVSMAEVEDGENAEVSMNGGVSRKDRADDRNTPPPVNGNGARDAGAGADEDGFDEDEDMRDD
ncbi:uncharacterized protein Z520_03212 [Fonsecaea multimorphosa CBS 102226]|uniref:Uncharacterized protein n=1 Tax=Fonsecaea multimorphosa CBS 102226 TaxID=1442371 RepID=A0A0D2KUX1_9EURO|nr:uncharacterized protein Z520_03212 [Fonsecaea multimorphosa CBS 102226]KIY00549.1 hypothetical protein Z520_03212 [Fonsecaea multimorphosa CBS 102226]OAL18945.1 hypothetical protein AYO22_10274 [Fonsecaea multimorphosa]